MATAGAAGAQVAGAVNLQSDYRLRGYSMSGGEPVATLNLSYDHLSGGYLNGVVIGGRGDHDNPAVIGVIENIGYARRLSSRASIDAGVVRSDYFQPNTDAAYTEAYVGLTTSGLSARLSYSPDYFSHGVSVLYGEIDGGLETSAQIRVNAHVGYLNCLDAPQGLCSNQYDWRLGASRQFGRLDLNASLSGAEAKSSLLYRRPSQGPALVVGASWAF